VDVGPIHRRADARTHRLTYLQLMNRNPIPAASSDLALAVIVPVACGVQVATGNIAGPLWVGVFGGVILGLSMLWRQTRPWLVLVVVFTTIVGTSLLGLSQQGLYGAFLAGFVALYGLACRVSLGRSCIGLAFGLVMAYWSAHENGVANLGFAVFILGGAVILGRAVGSHRLLAEHLREAVDELDKQRGELVQAAVAEEKVQIARELHDVIAHAVSVIVIQASAAEGMLDSSPERAREPLGSVQESGRLALGELRRLLAVLRPDVAPYMALSPQPGLKDLDALAMPLREAGLAVDVHLEGGSADVPAGVDLAAYRIIQEALTNVLKHANARSADVKVQCLPHRIDIEVIDDGSRPIEPACGGHGLIGMRERAAAYSGDMHLEEYSGGGHVLRATLEMPGN
jgi:signal transduction histidine kinase